MTFSDWLFATTRRTSSISLTRLTRLLFDYLCALPDHTPAHVAALLLEDYQQNGRRDSPDYLRPYLSYGKNKNTASGFGEKLPKRQGRHQAACD